MINKKDINIISPPWGDLEGALVPAIIQDATTKNVLMLGYMNEEAYQKTIETKQVTFFSRSKQRLWTKGEESGNFLNLVDIKNDCDNDTLLIQVNPVGPTCHKGTDTCWQTENTSTYGFFSTLEDVIAERVANKDTKKSYVASLFDKGINKVAQKVGEEAVETVIEAMDNNDELFLYESADLLFHYLMLLQAKGFSLKDIEEELKGRHK
ncbi:bifunctional phosphoribosyl-AMP cyclohydrolase/phosphoribosyl-ATP diphosphatase HisIE [Flavivirga abyssicola]|uniref:bifunctional phosphoribosyl-AMP cyclohydrolase/phosphoribosyl-ATP diphosphatase HisIE n=1 Tax=Flavivirga abyssicola TaxID=3063533 RepID=UPI0026E110B4|nr:bifunctional phosphoribosyl-AMP cyclohydrolase/phosphoribosyl-ATP diphosphatase HisIE [Flavivirga sp. MEBiC07777]WVK12933.1 bifunctional phosphoribosyl-AMP cyclohydrolase/phosphoribosyl-ATP diphosphatase HisIE [Flavivirga sp. MEBiC07777]